jgi:hypothetical protein
MWRMNLVSAVCALAIVAAACADKGDKDDQAGDVSQGETTGCTEGATCDDGDPCTANDTCQEGTCQPGEPYSCEQLPCTSSACDGKGGCQLGALLDGWCLINGACFAAEQPDPGSSCRFCDPAKSPTGWSAAEAGTACEDGNICTEQDYCDNGDCLAGTPPTCADGIQCTVDSCDLATGCAHVPDDGSCIDENACTQDSCQPEQVGDEKGCVHTPDDSLPCGDGNVCTLEACHEGICVTEPDPLDCDDANVCTDETCHEAYGCLYTFNDKECDDKEACTENDVCHFGKCLGVESWWSECPACNLSFSDQVAKIVKLRVGDGGYPGEALNIDSDLKTCSPDGMCEQGLDNNLMLAGDFIDEIIAENLTGEGGGEADPLIFVAEAVAPTFDGAQFLVNVYYAGLSASNPDCDFMKDKCTYEASSLNFGPLCDPQITFPNATIVDGVLTAGGSGYIFPFKMTFVNGETAETVLYAARLKADVLLDGDGKIETLKGVMGGAITNENLVELIEAIPDEYIPFDKETIIGLIEMVPNDIDLNGDGSKDAASIALVFETIPGLLADYQEY